MLMDIIIQYSEHLETKSNKQTKTRFHYCVFFFMNYERRTTKKIFKKFMLCLAIFSMLFTSIFSNITPTLQWQDDKTFFEVNKADDVIKEAKKHTENLMFGELQLNSFDCSGYVSYVFKQTD